MKKWAFRFTWILVWVMLQGSGVPSRPAVPEIHLSHLARSLQPGEVVLISASCSTPLRNLRARGFDKEFLFYPTQGSFLWKGLVGIDLQTPPGEYSLQLEATSDEGAIVEASYLLSVVGKEFPVRRLTVSRKFATPPEEEQERIRRERKRVSTIFKTISAEKLWNGNFLRPVPGEATSSFGKRSILNGQLRSPHSGTDFRASQGTPVKAPNVGRVVLASDLYFSGKTVILDHGLGLYSYFAHLSGLEVREGEMVSRGNLIGYVGATGRVTGPHLHWTVRLAETRVDPLSLMAVLETR